jgi:hypothetical protein
LIVLIEPHYPKGEGGRPAYPLMAMRRVHLMQNWFGYSDPAMEEALYETTILRQFSGPSRFGPSQCWVCTSRFSASYSNSCQSVANWIVRLEVMLPHGS